MMENNQIWRISYFVLSFCLATRRCMNLSRTSPKSARCCYTKGSAQDTAKFNHHNAAIIARMAEGVGSPAVTDPFHDSADRGA